MKKYHAYIRVSTVKQGERGSSLAEQKSAIQNYASRYGLQIGRWFEETETAAKQGRHSFAELLRDLRAGKAHGLIVHKIDRSARNLRDWADLGDLIDRGIDVRFVSDNFDLLSRGGRLSADIQAVVAADYIRNLREEVKKGLFGRLKQGFYPFAAPLGYRNNGGAAAKTIDPIKGPLVREMFETYAKNTMGFERLRLEMAAKGLVATGGKPLHKASMTKVLNNPFYIGVMRHGPTGETYPGAHEALISKETFDRVQLILRGKTVPKSRVHHFVLRKMVRCEGCSCRTLTGEKQKGHVYYRCHGCTGISWSGDTLVDFALNQIRRVRLNQQDLGDLRDILAPNLAATREDCDRRLNSVKLQVSRMDQRLARLTDLLVDGALDKEAHNVRREALLKERQGLLSELSRPQQHSPLENLLRLFELGNTKLLQYESLIDDEKREMLEIVCSNFSASEKSLAFTLRSPFREIANSTDFDTSGPYRDDVRTYKAIAGIAREFIRLAETGLAANDNRARNDRAA